jgi:hypothetical protein
MPADYTYAVQFGSSEGDDKVNDVKNQLRQGSTRPAEPDNTTDDCVWYQANKPMRLVKLHDLLITLAASNSQSGFGPTTKAQVLSDLAASNLGYVADLAAANTTLRMCRSARQLLSAGMLGEGLDIKASIDKTCVLKWSETAGANGSFCNWEQISCNNGVVNDVNIWSGMGIQGLQGSLPSTVAFQGLGKLRSITIADQPGITSTLPADWGQLRQLRDIRLVNISLIGQIPSSWGNMADPVVLALYTNRLNGPIPDNFGTLVKLQSLSLSENALDGRMPESLGNLQSLTLLELDTNKLSGPIPDSESFQKALEILQHWRS